VTRPARPATCFVGAGRLTRALLPLLDRAGYRVAWVAARRLASARSACRGVDGVRVTRDPARAAQDAGLLLLAVPDRAVAALARELSGAVRGGWSRRVVLHHAGALGPEVLRPLARLGAPTGVLHPMQALGDPAAARLVLPGSRARIEGHPRAMRAARRLARDLGLVPLAAASLSPAGRQTYHAAASLLSNDLIALLSLAVDLLESIGMQRGDAVRALGPLGRGTLAQAERRGLAAALTGPVVRGDSETVAAHLRRLARHGRDAAELHRILSRRLLCRAREQGVSLPRDAERRLRELLRPGESGRR